jgi:hypothetical protein
MERLAIPAASFPGDRYEAGHGWQALAPDGQVQARCWQVLARC